MAQEYSVSQNNTYKLTFDLEDETGSAITLSALSTFICTLYYYNDNILTGDRYHLATINNRYHQNVKNANNVTVSSTGAVTWYVQPEDNTKLNSATTKEYHIALFEWYWNSKRNSTEVIFEVKKIEHSS